MFYYNRLMSKLLMSKEILTLQLASLLWYYHHSDIPNREAKAEAS